MKNCNETIKSVFERIDQYEVQKRRKRKIITRAVTSISCCCFVALLGVGVFQMGLFKSEPDYVESESFITSDSISETDSKADTSNTNSEVDTSDTNGSADVSKPSKPSADSVIWGNDDYEGLIERNGKTISISLNELLSEVTQPNDLIAIRVSFRLYNEFVYNSKTLREYAEEYSEESSLITRMGQLTKLGDMLKYGEALYETGAPNGEKWAKTLYFRTIERIGEDLLSKYIVDGEFLKEALEKDLEALINSHPCADAYEEAKLACFKDSCEIAKEYLESKNIYCEIENDQSVIFFAGADVFEKISVKNASQYSLATNDFSECE